MRLAFFVALLLSGIVSLKAQRCRFDPAGPQEVHWGHIRGEMKIGPVRTVSGKVLDPGSDPIPAAEMVLFRVRDGRTRFVGFRRADVGGRFCFGRFRAGKYELRVGAPGFNSMVFFFRVRRDSRRTIRVTLPPGT
jgi:hypothetical protein